MRSLRNIFLLIPAFIYGVSCQVIEEIQYDENVKILVSINDEYQTRVSDDGKSFVEGDEIQVVNMSRETNNSATFIYDGMGWSTEDVILWSTQGDNVFKAWHPADASFDSFTIPTNQSAGLGGSDWMTAQSTARPSEGGVSLRFSRHLTKVKVAIESWGDEYADSEKKVARLDLMSSSSVMSNDGNEIAGNSTPTPVITYILEEDRSMVAIIAPGEYSAGDEFMNVYINGNFSEPLKVYTAKQLILHPGMAYELKLIIGRDRIDISPDAIYVTDWDDEILDDQIVSEQAVVDLSEEGTANSYIVSQKGAYKFSTVKGNSSESVGAVASADVLWESFGTDVTPNVGDLVKNAAYSDGYITFQTADTFKEGNAVIAAKDASGNILWSWHVWLTDEPQGQVYYNNAGTMMDRNLGATSATPGDVGALGLLYQWGRKDPFLGSSSISEGIKACSTTSWSSTVESDSSNGTLEYAIANPTTFISANNLNNDWYYTGTSLADDTRWTGSESTKAIYDPCPRGWRVPDGGDNGVWAKAVGSTSSLSGYQYQQSNEGINFSGVFGASSVIWYPTPGGLNDITGSLEHVGYSCRSWASSAYRLFLDSTGYLTPAGKSTRAYGYTVRCVSENPELEVPEEPSEPEPSQPSYSLHLKPSTYGWVKSSTVLNPDASLYDGVYESTNQGVNDTESVMYIDINGYDEFTFYVRSYAESSYDYVQVSNLDTGISSLKMTTKGNQQSGTSLSSYTEVTFTNIGGGQHRITVVYVKDYSQHSADDKGYVLIPKTHASNTPDVPSEPHNGDYVDEYGINHGQGVEIFGVVWAPVNCGYHATDYKYGKLYQWGRKYGQGYSGYLYDASMYPLDRYSDASAPSIVSGPVSLSEGQSSSNSNNFYSSSGNNDWITQCDRTLWNSGTEDNPIKTEYDPCPDGWRVPTYVELNYLESCYSSWTTNNDQKGYWLSQSSVSESRLFFPAAGRRRGYDGTADLRDYCGNYWSSMAIDEIHTYCIYFTSSAIAMTTFERSAYGYSVRCVQE